LTGSRVANIPEYHRGTATGACCSTPVRHAQQDEGADMQPSAMEITELRALGFADDNE